MEYIQVLAHSTAPGPSKPASVDASGLSADEVWTSVFAWLPFAVAAGMATASS